MREGSDYRKGGYAGREIRLDLLKHKGAHVYAQEDADSPRRRDGTYADDTGFFTLVEDRVRIARAVCKLTAAIHQGLVQRDPAPSYGAGKSRILAAIKGPASFAAKTDTRETLGAKVCALEVDVEIALARAAKHLGGVLEVNGATGPEARCRQTQAA